MTLTVAEIERWGAGDVREVFHAARSRAQAAFDAADGLATLPALSSWGGEAATAAREAIGRTRIDLDSHGNEALMVADAARRAADSIEGIQSDLAQLKVAATVWGLEVDPSTNRIVPIPGSRHSRLHSAIPLLQDRLNSIVEQANTTDSELTAVIRLADGTTPLSPSLHTDSAEVKQALAGPLPEDSEQFSDLWRKLSTQDRDLLYSRDHNIGNHPGMPAGSDTDPGSDYYNRLHLADELATAHASGAENLPDLRELENQLRGHPERKLMLFDTTSGERVHAAIAVGDPDTADHVSVTTPGMNTTVRSSMGSMVSEATTLRRQALNQLARTRGREAEGVAAIAWIGYDAPQVHMPDTGSDVADAMATAVTAQGIYQVSHDDVAKAGAADLARFYDGIAAAHGGAPLDLTAIGHSYGSLTTGLALQQPGDHAVDNAIFYGSPGIEATTPAQLHLEPGRVFIMQTADDPIQWVYHGPKIARVLAPVIPGPLDDILLVGAELTGAGEFGPEPAASPNFVHMETGPAEVIAGPGEVLNFDGAHGHSEYPRLGTTYGPDGQLLPRTTGYNIAAVVAGLDENVIRQ